MSKKMNLKGLRAIKNSLNGEMTEWRNEKGIQDPIAKEMAKLSKEASKAKRLHAKMGKKMRKR